MIFVGVSSFLPPPIWNTENEHGWQVFHCASAAAIFIGWYLVSMTPSWLPTIMARRIAGSSTTSESLRRPPERPRPCCACAQVPGRHREHHQRAGDQRGQQHVGVAPDEHRVGEHGADVVELRAGSSSG